VFCDNREGPRRQYGQWNKSDTERYTQHVSSYIKSKKVELTEVEGRIGLWDAGLYRREDENRPVNGYNMSQSDKSKKFWYSMAQ
jgi:hypothetical protein